MNSSAIAARKQYMKKYRAEHREAINKKQKEWRKNNPDKMKKIVERYWERRWIGDGESTL